MMNHACPKEKKSQRIAVIVGFELTTSWPQSKNVASRPMRYIHKLESILC